MNQVAALRSEYSALVLIADGLIAVIRTGAACNIATVSRMAEEAKDAAHKLAQMIERVGYACPVGSVGRGSIVAGIMDWIVRGVRNIGTTLSALSIF